MSPSRPRTVHASAAQWTRIRERAERSQMTVSAFLVACALHEETSECDSALAPGAVQEHRLVLTAQEQRQLYEGMKRMDECVEALLGNLPEVEMSVLEALSLVARCHRALDKERKRLRAMDGEYLA